MSHVPCGVKTRMERWRVGVMVCCTKALTLGTVRRLHILTLRTAVCTFLSIRVLYVDDASGIRGENNIGILAIWGVELDYWKHPSWYYSTVGTPVPPCNTQNNAYQYLVMYN